MMGGAMAYRSSRPAPESATPAERRGKRVGHFCRDCGGVYPPHAGTHQGKPVYGKDHVSSPCSHEGEAFAPGQQWWEPAVEVLPAPVVGSEPQDSQREADGDRSR